MAKIKLNSSKGNPLADKYPYIVKWCKLMGSYDYYVELQFSLAEQYNCPPNTTSVDSNGKYHTTDDIKSNETRHWMGLELLPS